MATPIVTGVAALLLGIDPSLRFDKLKEYIISSATPGAPNASPTQALLVHDGIGGRLNACRAVSMAMQLPTEEIEENCDRCAPAIQAFIECPVGDEACHARVKAEYPQCNLEANCTTCL